MKGDWWNPFTNYIRNKCFPPALIIFYWWALCFHPFKQERPLCKEEDQSCWSEHTDFWEIWIQKLISKKKINALGGKDALLSEPVSSSAETKMWRGTQVTWLLFQCFLLNERNGFCLLLLARQICKLPRRQREKIGLVGLLPSPDMS